jgi:formate/nitrite transporter FocA (FNT family)
MMLGAKITFADWWLWNQIPVTLGNFVGGLLFIAIPWFLTFHPAAGAKTPQGDLEVGAAEAK